MSDWLDTELLHAHLSRCDEFLTFSLLIALCLFDKITRLLYVNSDSWYNLVKNSRIEI